MESEKKIKTGRPTAYKEEYAEQARKLCLLGATDKDLANFFNVTEQTINGWKKKHDQFFESIRLGKEIADAEVAEKLYKRALGYSHEDCHVSNYQGAVIITPLTKHYPPDTQAASLWLRNRQPGKWRDKQDHEHTGNVSFVISKDDASCL